jgi:pimeloyl-ACP methyl ester carboxylesterase
MGEIPANMHVFHGTQDRLVPLAFAKHLAENIPNCELHLLENQGHLFPLDHQELIFKTAKLGL